MLLSRYPHLSITPLVLHSTYFLLQFNPSVARSNSRILLANFGVPCGGRSLHNAQKVQYWTYSVPRGNSTNVFCVL